MVTLYQSDFEEWWSRYPRKVGKQIALSCYSKLRDDGTPADLLLEAVTAYVEELRENNTEAKYIKHASRFLGPQREFEDYARMKGWNE